MAHSPAMGAAAPATSLSPFQLQTTAEVLALLGRGALTEISALCTVSLAALETSGTWDTEDLALCLQMIRSKADDIANCIDHEASEVNIDLTCPRFAARRAARTGGLHAQTTRVGA